MITTEDFAALVSSRICHDLISPIGAIGNGFELMTMTGHGGGPELALISESAESASARVRFFRIAFGSAKEGQAIGPKEIKAILSARSKDGRFRYQCESEMPIDRSEAKLLFLMFLCIEHALPRGGELLAAQKSGGWVVEADGERLCLDPDLWAALERREAPQPLDSGRIHFAALAMTLEAMDRRLAVEQTGRRLILSL
jgi:histidine phosphotransferase ChpT